MTTLYGTHKGGGGDNQLLFGGDNPYFQLPLLSNICPPGPTATRLTGLDPRTPTAIPRARMRILSYCRCAACRPNGGSVAAALLEGRKEMNSGPSLRHLRCIANDGSSRPYAVREGASARFMRSSSSSRDNTCQLHHRAVWD